MIQFKQTWYRDVSLHEGRLVKVWVKLLEGQRSKVNELYQNWLKIAPKLILFTINPNPIMHFKKTWYKNHKDTGMDLDRLVRLEVKEVRGQRSNEHCQTSLNIEKQNKWYFHFT